MVPGVLAGAAVSVILLAIGHAIQYGEVIPVPLMPRDIVCVYCETKTHINFKG